MTWFREAASAPNGRLSSSRLIALVAGLTLSLCTFLLTIGAFIKTELVTPLTAFGPFLATLAGANYAVNRLTVKKESSSAE